MFRKILVANRGEIACRVIATARRMGIATVAVYSEADREARHVRMADEAVLIGPAPSRESYLSIDRILAACRATGAEAVHPGYGFLSENREFSRRAEEEGVTFIGPKHASIAAMGDKIASKKLAHEARVSTIPGWLEPLVSPEQAVEVARTVGYPVMIKASAGGGGKGLRVAFNDKEAFEGFTSCRNEALSSFGDDRVFLEKYVQQPRHIEIQVLGDAHGNLVYLNERECSIQRRHQKVIEEAPSPFLDEATRAAMGAQAVALARAVNYQSAGTVEFVVGKDRDFYFLEMNTRLQVEHPVTECITGLDLVELMIRVAAGEKLPITQADVRRDGWAIECRINAEDPYNGFLPSTGRLVRFSPPDPTLFQAQPGGRFGVRVDTGVYEGGEIPMHYDSMIAKLIVHGEDRVDAILRMREALNGFVVRGISSNVPFQAALLGHPAFERGQFDTGFIAAHYATGFRAEDVPHGDPGFLVALAAFVRRKSRERASTLMGQLRGYEMRIGQDFTVVVLGPEGKHQHQLVHVEEYQGHGNLATIKVGERSYRIESPSRLGEIRINGTVNGTPFVAQVERGTTRNPLVLHVQHNGARLEALVLTPRQAELHKLMPYKPPPDLSRYLLSPMPGLLAGVAVQPGQKVRTGDRLAVIEAMKMENILVAARDGVVKTVTATQGDSLAVGQVILEFE